MAQAPKIKKTVNSNTQKNINTKPEIEGDDRRLEFYKEPLENNAYLPLGVTVNDIDIAFIDYIKNDVRIVLNNEIVPVHDFSRQRLSESLVAWMDRDDDKTFTLPFISITKDSLTSKGTNFKTYNIPKEIFWGVHKVEKIENNVKKYDYYSIPQPVNVDINYTISVYTAFLDDVTVVNEYFLNSFAASPVYLNIKGYYMGMYLEIEQSDKKELTKRRYYHHNYKITIKGYISNPENYVKLTSINKIDMDIVPKKRNEQNVTITRNADCKKYSFFFKRNELNPINYIVKEPLNFGCSNYNDIFSYFNLYINGVEVNDFPLILEINDVLQIVPINSSVKNIYLEFFEFECAIEPDDCCDNSIQTNGDYCISTNNANCIVVNSDSELQCSDINLLANNDACLFSNSGQSIDFNTDAAPCVDDTLTTNANQFIYTNDENCISVNE